jgi:hypothetical protein
VLYVQSHRDKFRSDAPSSQASPYGRQPAALSIPFTLIVQAEVHQTIGGDDSISLRDLFGLLDTHKSFWIASFSFIQISTPYNPYNMSNFLVRSETARTRWSRSSLDMLSTNRLCNDRPNPGSHTPVSTSERGSHVQDSIRNGGGERKKSHRDFGVDAKCD